MATQTNSVLWMTAAAGAVASAQAGEEEDEWDAAAQDAERHEPGVAVRVATHGHSKTASASRHQQCRRDAVLQGGEGRWVVEPLDGGGVDEDRDAAHARGPPEGQTDPNRKRRGVVLVGCS